MPVADNMSTCQSSVESFKWLVVWSLEMYRWSRREWYLHCGHPLLWEPSGTTLHLSVLRTAVLLLTQLGSCILWMCESCVCETSFPISFWLNVSVKSEIHPNMSFVYYITSIIILFFSLSFSRIQSRKKLLILLPKYIWIHLLHFQL